jgi:ferrous iron transport protein B
MLGNEPASPTPAALRTVALIGNPNTGKSSLFNALCGMNARVGNYPGVTVEQKVGRLIGSRLTVDVIDLPGTYSLAARSADEAVAVNVLTGTFPTQAKPELAVVILDAANIERNLYLFSQIYELGLPVLVVLNMWDRVDAEGITVEADLLSKRLGVPVVCTSANKRKGIELVREAIERLLLSPSETIQPNRFARAQFPEVFHTEVEELGNWLASQGKSSFRFQVDRLLIDTDGEYQRSLCQSGLHEINDRIAEARNRLAEAGCKVPMFETKTRYAWIRRTIEGAVTRRESKSVSWSDKVDKWLTHRWVGMFAFVLIMFLVFQSITFFSAFPMQGIEAIQGWVGVQVEGVLPPGALRSLFVDGVVAGVGGVLMFLLAFIAVFMA